MTAPRLFHPVTERVIYYWCRGWTAREIAETIGITESRVKAIKAIPEVREAKYRALAEARERLADLLVDKAISSVQRLDGLGTSGKRDDSVLVAANTTLLNAAMRLIASPDALASNSGDSGVTVEVIVQEPGRGSAPEETLIQPESSPAPESIPDAGMDSH